MDLFGIREHDDRHDEVERQLRHLIEQVAQLSIDLSVTRTQMRTLHLTVEGKVTEADMDPSILALNESIKKARVKLAQVEEAADEQWASINDELSQTIDTLREQAGES